MDAAAWGWMNRGMFGGWKREPAMVMMSIAGAVILKGGSTLKDEPSKSS